MGGAIIRGGISSNIIDPLKLHIYERNLDKVQDLLEAGSTMANSEEDLVKSVNKLILAIKPYGMSDLGKKIKNHLNENTLIISIAAGVSFENLKKYFGENNKYVRVMPNTPALINEGISAITFDDNISDSDKDYVMRLFESVGKVVLLEESKLAAFSGCAGSMPAYVQMFIESSADAAVKNGLKRKDAYKIIAQAVQGSARLLLETELHPGELKDQVTSPSGSTIQGVMVLEKEGFRNAIISAVDIGTQAAKKLD